MPGAAPGLAMLGAEPGRRRVGGLTSTLLRCGSVGVLATPGAGVFVLCYAWHCRAFVSPICPTRLAKRTLGPGLFSLPGAFAFLLWATHPPTRIGAQISYLCFTRLVLPKRAHKGPHS